MQFEEYYGAFIVRAKRLIFGLIFLLLLVIYSPIDKFQTQLKACLGKFAVEMACYEYQYFMERDTKFRA